MNILTTIPKAKFSSWKTCERVLRQCDGDPNTQEFWLINTANLPKKIKPESVCYMIYDGKIRGYFHIINTDLSENWREMHDIGKPRNTHCIALATWRPITPIPYTGFQGWRYTELKP